MALLIVDHGQQWYVAMLAGVAVGALIGLIIGVLRGKTRHPVVRGDAGLLPGAPRCAPSS